MKLYLQIIKLLFNKFILRKNTGLIIKQFAEKMGIVYIKLAQMLATQNYGHLFTEEDRQILSNICDNSKPIKYNAIETILKEEYGSDLTKIFSYIAKESLGSASVSQVHRAILKNGQEVVIKIKRKDITRHIEKDINKIRKLMHYFGKLIKFGNFSGGNHALDLYLTWLYQEIDFTHEVENIKAYQKFAKTVNGKVSLTQSIIIKVYPEYCTSNIIVMSYIKTPTINKLELTPENKAKINKALNSYIKSSFWALFNNKEVIFHGDPHSGNICLDDKGNIYFLDMGLLCTLSKKDAELTKQLFFAAYSGNHEKLYQLLASFGTLNKKEEQILKNFCQQYCENVKTKNITYYFVDVINACLICEINPPDFLFSMAKAFVCLNGICNFSENKYSAQELLQEQVLEYLFQRSIKDSQEILLDILKITPQMLENIYEYGLINTFAKITTHKKLNNDTKKLLENLKEMLLLIKNNPPKIQDEPKLQRTKPS